MDCIECGSCSFICPSNRPLLDYIRFGKQNVGAMIRARMKK
jgi:electron transport complex protein RnfC